MHVFLLIDVNNYITYDLSILPLCLFKFFSLTSQSLQYEETLSDMLYLIIYISN